MALRVTLVGAGILGRRYARVLGELASTELVAIVNRTASRGEELAAAHGARPFTGLEQALDEVAADAVVVATADHVHHAPVMTALGRGLDVMVEKPLATVLGDAREMTELAAQKGRVLHVNYSQRGVEDYRWVRDRIAAGDIGRPRLVQHVRHDRIDVPTGMIPGWAMRTSPVFFMSSHDLDLLAWFLDARAIRVAAQEHRGVLLARGLDVHDAVDAILTFDSGATAAIHTSWIHPESHPVLATDRFMIVGDEGSIEYRGRGRHGELYGSDVREVMDFTGPHTADDVDGRLTGAFVASVEEFVRCVAERAEPETSAANTLHITATQVAILAAARSGEVVEVEGGR